MNLNLLSIDLPLLPLLLLLLLLLSNLLRLSHVVLSGKTTQSNAVALDLSRLVSTG